MFHVDEPTDFSSRAAVSALLEILTILGRGDVRTDVNKRARAPRGSARPLPEPARCRFCAAHGAHRQHGELRKHLSEACPQVVNPVKNATF